MVGISIVAVGEMVSVGGGGVSVMVGETVGVRVFVAGKIVGVAVRGFLCGWILPQAVRKKHKKKHPFLKLTHRLFIA
jgi:hypothetical protein